jgi:GNAT superfamily N-acetyltransferase
MGCTECGAFEQNVPCRRRGPSSHRGIRRKGLRRANSSQKECIRFVGRLVQPGCAQEIPIFFVMCNGCRVGGRAGEQQQRKTWFYWLSNKQRIMHWVASPELALAVKPEHRRHGVGTALLTQLVRTNPDPSTISISFVAGKPVLRLYERFGFKVVEQRPDAVVMQRPA